MAYYPDLSAYAYCKVNLGNALTLNIGWLERGLSFLTARPEEWLLDKLWAHCRFAVYDARGHHSCDLPKCTWHKRRRVFGSGAPHIPRTILLRCEQDGSSPHPNYPTVATYRQALAVTRVFYERTLITAARHHHKEELGYSEIRIFGKNDIVYAAPNLIFHYVRDHHYKMPDEVIEALRTGPCPPEKEWFDRLRLTGTPLDMVQCYRRARRLGFTSKKSDVRGLFDIPTGPVKWIPETLHPNWLKVGRHEAFGLRQSPGAFPEKPKQRRTAKPKARTSHSVRAAPAHRTAKKPKH